jgi:hypothetical protein
LSEYGVRSDLPWPLRPGERITLPILVATPQEPGHYLLQLDLVRELVTWFEDQGAGRLLIPVDVSAAGP